MTARPLQVLLAMPFATALGGAERYLQLVARRARDHGLELHVVLHEEGPLLHELRELGLRVDVVALGRFRDVVAGMRAVRRLRALVAADPPDIAFSWLPRSHVHLAPAARLAGLPAARIAWWQHHLPTGEPLERAATIAPAAAVFVASRVVAEAQERLWPHRPTRLVRYGIEDVHPTPADTLQVLRERLGIPPGAAVVGIPGRLVRWKRQDALLEAVALLRARGLNVHALVIGGSGHRLDPGFDAELEHRAARPDLAGHVTFTGHVEDAVRHAELLDVLVNASVGEPFGLTIVEAQAIGVPALAVDVGGPTESIEHGTSGWLVPDGSPETLAEGLATLLGDERLRARLAQDGKAAYLAGYTADAGVGRFADALRALDAEAPPLRLARRPRGGSDAGASS